MLSHACKGLTDTNESEEDLVVLLTWCPPCLGIDEVHHEEEVPGHALRFTGWLPSISFKTQTEPTDSFFRRKKKEKTTEHDLCRINLEGHRWVLSGPDPWKVANWMEKVVPHITCLDFSADRSKTPNFMVFIWEFEIINLGISNKNPRKPCHTNQK